MIRMWLEVFDPSYITQVSNGIVELVGATVTRVLDGVGSVSVDTDATGDVKAGGWLGCVLGS